MSTPIIQSSDIRRVVEYARNTLSLSDARLGDEYYYSSLPLCVIDAVFSIGVRYTAVRGTINRYCAHFNLPCFRTDRRSLPPRELQQSISKFCTIFDSVGLETMTEQAFRNRQRTSARAGILKSEATLRFASVLRRHEIEDLQDAQFGLPETAVREIKTIPGQGSGISAQYFNMLAGSDDLIKPDRMILRFLQKALARDVSVPEAQPILSSVAQSLRQEFVQLTPRLLDHAIWNHQRGSKADGG